MEEQVIQAVRLLYDAQSSGEERQKANAWLESFQNRVEAWQVSMGLLGGSNPEIALFAAQTLKHKVCLLHQAIPNCES